MLLDQAPGQRQPQTGAFVAAACGRVQLHEFLEQLLLVLGGDADSGVGHRHPRQTIAVVEAARRDLPDLILMDLQMPGMDGFAALDALRRDAAFASIPVVALTAYAMVGDRERALRAGFDGYITKPIDVRAFPAEVARYLSNPAPPSAA